MSSQTSPDALAIVELLEHFGPAYRRFVGETLPTGASQPRLRVLAALAEQGPMTMSEVRAQVGGSAQNLTVLIDALERDGAVTRLPHPHDRRATLVELKEKTAAEVRTNRRAQQRKTAQLFASLSTQKQAQLRKILTELIADLNGSGRD